MVHSKLSVLAKLPFLFLVFLGDSAFALDPAQEDAYLKLLGKYVFFDKISEPERMACVTCHDPDTGGTGSVSGVNLHQVAITGADSHTVGNLKPPTNAYASLIDTFKTCSYGTPGLCGGNFWNGRAEGSATPLFPNGASAHIGDEIFRGPGDPHKQYVGATSDQALNPMLNPVEQNMRDRQAVCQQVADAKYEQLYQLAWGEVEPIDCSGDPTLAVEQPFDISFKRLMLAVGAWQHSSELNSFSSKRDIALTNELDGKFPLVGFTAQENLGHDLFYGETSSLNPDGKSAGCFACHSNDPDAEALKPAGDKGTVPEETYAESAYHNIGVPRNPEIPKTFNEDGSEIDPDMGLAGHTGVMGQDLSLCGGPPNPGTGARFKCDHRGFFKTPTLRNVDKRKVSKKEFIKAYAHNGWFKSMESIVHFYNTGKIDGATAATFGVTRCPEGVETEKDALANNCWPAPAHANPGQLGSPTFGARLGTTRPFGDLDLTLEEEAALVAYLKTLTDTETPIAPKPYKPVQWPSPLSPF